MEIKPILLSLKQRKAFSTLIVLQVAITLSVMTISALLTRVTLKEWNLPSGLAHDNIVAVYPQIFDNSVNQKETVINDLEKLKNLPGVVNATPTNQIPFSAEQLTEIRLQETENAQTFQTSIFDLDENGFDTLNLKLIAGRKITAADVVYNEQTNQLEPAVVMISQQMAEALFEKANAIGQSIIIERGKAPVEVVGVYSNFMNGERLNFVGQSYRSIIRPRVSYVNGSDPNYLIRVEPGKTEAFLETIRNELYQTNGRFIQQVEFLTRTQKRMYDGRGSRSLLMLFISFILLFITGLGISGLISFLVARQKKQIGIRRALGAKRWQIVQYYLVENSIITIVGLILGVGFTIALIIFMGGGGNQQIFHAGWMLAIAVFIWLISITSALSPAIRASKVAPAVVTRG